MKIFSIFFNIVAAMGAFIFVIGIHEWGHFLIARYLGVCVIRLNLGFGKPLWRKKSKNSEMEYAISPILLGGYVKLLDEREGKVPEELLSKSLTRQLAWKRLAILGAGPLINFIAAVVLFMLVLMSGLPYLKPVVGEVLPTSLAQKAGFQQGDILLSIEEKPVYNWMMVNFQLIESFGEKGLLHVSVLSSDGQKKHLKILLSQWKLDPVRPDLLSSMGIQASLDPQLMRIKKENPLQALSSACEYMISYAHLNGVIIYKILRGVLSIRSLAGPISLWTASVESLKKGVVYYCFFLGFLSVSVGAFNLLPVPGLDGFQMLIVLAEKIRRKPISTAFQLLMYQLGLIGISILLIQVVLNDIARYLASS